MGPIAFFHRRCSAGFPVLGNLFDMPTEKHWLKFTEWAEEFGDVVYLNIPGTPIVILNSLKATNELMEKRSANYSDRPYSHMINDLMGWDFDVVFMGYSERWRKYRRLFRESFNQRAVDAYYPIQMAATNLFLKNLLDSPQDHMSHVQQLSGSIILRIVYGYDVTVKYPDYLALAEEAMRQIIEASTPGKYLVELMPFLKHIPEWVPGAGFKRQAALYKKTTEALIETPYQKIAPNLENGTALSCFVTQHMENMQEGDTTHDLQTIKNCAAVMFLAGADTTYAVLTSFMLCAVIHPEIQAKAQAEIDLVVGKSRLPNFEDRPHLPYVEAMLLETLRWNPALPMGFMHRSMDEDVYNGHYIPAKSLIIGNVWAIFRNETDYPDPDSFKPERFLKSDGKDLPPNPAEVATFGFGRRACPGRYLALNSAWLAIASMLAAFTLAPAQDEYGRDIVLEPLYTDGHIRYPEPFKCVIKPRSEDATRLVKVAAGNVTGEV
ncbi:cytochrome P450 [Hymenopellis radicata]|nr:cytochrome P450 [Hymenopellis radicata]